MHSPAWAMVLRSYTSEKPQKGSHPGLAPAAFPYSCLVATARSSLVHDAASSFATLIFLSQRFNLPGSRFETLKRRQQPQIIVLV